MDAAQGKSNKNSPPIGSLFNNMGSANNRVINIGTVGNMSIG
jgi:hypothetical protein